MTSQPDEAQPLPSEAPVLQELTEIGFPYPSISALRESGVRYESAVPILVRWLSRAADDHRLKEELVRALSVPWARREALPALLEEFQDLTNPELLRWTVGNALSILAGNPTVTLTSFALDRRYGTARQMLVLRLGRAKDDASLDALIELVHDPDVDGHAVDALARRRSARATEALRAKVDDPRAWVRRAARRGLAAPEPTP